MIWFRNNKLALAVALLALTALAINQVLASGGYEIVGGGVTFGTQTDGKICTYSATIDGLVCNTDLGAATAAGDTAQIQYNDSDALSAEAGFTYTAATNLLTVSKASTTQLTATTIWGSFVGNLTGTASGNGIVNAGTVGQLAYYRDDGTGVFGTSTMFIAQNGWVGVGTNDPQRPFHVSGNDGFYVSDTYPDATKGFRARFGGATDFEFAGAGVYFSVWDNGNFSGTQRVKMLFESGNSIAQAVGDWQFKVSANGNTINEINSDSGGDVIFNEVGDSDRDFRIEGDTDANLFFLDASADRIGIGKDNPGSLFDIDGKLTATYASSTGITATTFWGSLIGDATGVTAGAIGIADLASVDFGGYTCNGSTCTVDSDGTWTGHNSYPAACSANQFVTTIGDTNTCSAVADITCTDCLNATEIEDIYLLDDGDVGTGNFDFGGATFLEIPNGTGATADDPGEITHDTSDNQLVMDDYVIPTKQYMRVTIASSTWTKMSGVVPLPLLDDAYTVINFHCYVTGGTSEQVTMTDGTNAMDTITCDADNATDDGTIANSTVTALERMKLTKGTTSGAVDSVTFTIVYRVTRE